MFSKSVSVFAVRRRICGMSKREWSASDQIQRHGDEAICSCPVSCLIGDGGNSTSHGVCRHIDDRGIDGDSISSLERCIHTIVTSLSTWLQESRDSLTVFAKNIKEGDIIYWVQGLCPNREKSLALGERGLEGLDRANCPVTQ